MAHVNNPLTSLVALSLFSLCLSSAVVGTAGHVLGAYHSQQSGLWWLPVWRSHFDARGLETLIGASVSLIVLNLVICSATCMKASFARFVILGLAGIAAVAALVEIAFPAAINDTSPGSDSMQTWTCQWAHADGSPNSFSTLCYESRFAYFAAIPVFVAQLLVVGLAVQNLFVARWQDRVQREEKGEELGSIVAAESVGSGYGDASGKGSPELHYYGRSSP